MAFAAPMEGDPGFVQQTITLLLMSGRFTEWYSDTKPLSLKAERAYELLRLIPELIVSETASGAILVRKRGPSNPSFVFPELLKKILEEGPALDLRISSIDGRAVPAPRLLKHIVLRVEDDENFRRAVGIARAFPSAESVTFLVRRGAPRARYEAYLVKAGLVGPRFLVHERRETWLFNGNVLDPEKLQESLPLSLRWNFHKMIFISFEDLVIPDRYATHSYVNSLTLLVLDAANSGVMVTVLEKIESERKTRMLAARQA